MVGYLFSHFVFFGSKNPWGTLRYKAGKYNKFKFDIAFFRGVNESQKSYFAIDDIKVIN